MVDAGNRPLGYTLFERVAAHRRSLSGLLLLGVLAVFGLSSLHWLSDPYRFPLDVVEVKGDFRFLQKQHLQVAVAPHATGGFFTVDVDGVRAAAEALAWVGDAKVRRVWPATLRIQITEQQPATGWNESGYLNADGDAFFPQTAATAVPDLPQLAGPEGQGRKVLQQFRATGQALQPLGLQVTSLTLDQRRAWSVQLDNGVQLRLGRSRPWQRLQRFVEAFPDVFAGRLAELQSVDMRYSNGFSVYWQELPASDVVAQRDT